MLTVDALKDYLGIDYTDTMTDNNLSACVSAANAYITGAIGNGMDTDPRALELAKIVAADLYDNRGNSTKVSNNVQKLVQDFSEQLRMERRAQNGF